MCREMNIEYVILIGAGIVAGGNSSGRIESGRSNSGRMIRIGFGLGSVRPPLTFWAHGSLLH